MEADRWEQVGDQQTARERLRYIAMHWSRGFKQNKNVWDQQTTGEEEKNAGGSLKKTQTFNTIYNDKEIQNKHMNKCETSKYTENCRRNFTENTKN